jgi:hypothetical protein
MASSFFLLFDRPIPARLDLKLYTEEVIDRVSHYRYHYKIKEEVFKKAEEYAAE